MKTNELEIKDGLIEGVVYRYINEQKGDEYGWCYVGDSTKENNRRNSWNNHGNKSYGGQKINEARKRIGIENFRYEVLERLYAETEEELQSMLDEREEYYINMFNSTVYGYNTSKGGTGQKGVEFTDEHKKKISQNHRNYQTTETKEKISESLKGHAVENETREKISIGNTGKKRTEEQKQAQSERMKGLTPEAATQGAKEWVKENGGGYWSNHSLSDEAKANMKAAQQKKGTATIAISPDGTKTTYNTMLDAAKDYGLNVGSVANSIKTGGTTRNGYKFIKS